MASLASLRGINFKLVLKGLRNGRVIESSIPSRQQQRLALTPAQRCGVLLIAHRHDKSILAASSVKQDIEAISQVISGPNVNDEVLDLGIGALLLMREKASDSEVKSKILRAMLAIANKSIHVESLNTAIECIEKALKGEVAISEPDTRALSSMILSTSNRFPQSATRLLGLLKNVPGSIPVSEEFLCVALDAMAGNRTQIGDVLTAVDIEPASSPLSREASLKVLYWISSDSTCGSSVRRDVLHRISRHFASFDDQTSIDTITEYVRVVSTQGERDLFEDVLFMNGMTASGLKKALEANKDTPLMKDLVSTLAISPVRAIQLLSRDGQEQASDILQLLLTLTSHHPDQFVQVLALASEASFFQADEVLQWCEKNTENVPAESRAAALNHILRVLGLDGSEDQMHRFEMLLRGCESSFSPVLVETWKQFHRWTSLEGLVQMAEESKGQKTIDSLVKAMRTCLKASSSTLSSHQIQSIVDFIQRSRNVIPPVEALSLLEDLMTSVSSAVDGRGSELALESVLDIIQCNLGNEMVCQKSLQMVGKMMEMNVLDLGQNSQSGVSPKIVSAIIHVLEARRERRQKATVQELQKDAWTDSGVFQAAAEVLHRIPCAKEEELLPERSDLSRAKRLLLFSPRPSEPDAIHNIKIYIAEMAQRDLLKDEENHPLALLAHVVRTAFPGFAHFGPNVHPVVTTQQSFDDLLVPEDHVSRRPTDTFYLTKQLLLRPHTSAHQTQFLRQGYTQFLVSGDVYRRDEIDKTHFPVFHQMEGVKVLPEGATTEEAFQDLQKHLNNLADILFPKMPRKWIDAYFPFTDPSLELEIEFRKKAVELLGCGVVHKDIMKGCGMEGRVAWAFGLGLERLAMLLFQIPDIRLFWSTDPRFLGQFQGAKVKFMKNRNSVRFKPFSRFPPTKRDISFWLPMGTTKFHINDFFSIVREVSGDNVEEVSQVDDFVGPDGRKSVSFRIIFRSDFKTLSGVEVSTMMADIVAKLESQFSVTVR